MSGPLLLCRRGQNLKICISKSEKCTIFGTDGVVSCDWMMIEWQLKNKNRGNFAR